MTVNANPPINAGPSSSDPSDRNERPLSMSSDATANLAEPEVKPPAKNSWSLQPHPNLILPVLFVHVIGGSIGMYPFNQFLLLEVCQSLGEKNETLPINGSTVMNLPNYESCSVRTDVQTITSQWVQILGLALSIPAFLVSPVIGHFVDRLGRRTVMFVPIFASVLEKLAVISIAYFDLSLWLLVGVRFIEGVLGGYAVLLTCAYAYLADTTTSTGRTEKFLLTDAAVFTAFSVGPFIGGLIYKELGLVSVFIITGTMELFALAYVVLVLPESLRKHKHGEGEPTSAETSSVLLDVPKLLALVWKSWIEIWTVFTPKGRGKSVMILASVMAVAQLVFAGYPIVFFAYPALKFVWSSYDSGVFSLFNSFMRLFYLTFLLPFLLRKFATGLSAVEKIRFELMVVRCGMLLYAIGFTCFGLASAGWMFYIIAFADGFGVVALPTVRAMLSRTVPNKSQGKLFSALEMIQSGSYLLSQLLIPTIYQTTLKTLPAAVCFVIAGIWASSLSLTSGLKSRELISLSEEEDRFGEDAQGTAAPAAASESSPLLGEDEIVAAAAELVEDAGREVMV